MSRAASIRKLALFGSLLATAIALPTAAHAFLTAIAPYTVSLVPDYTTRALLSVGDRVPETGDPTQEYQMVGIPDGLGVYRHGNEVTVFMNHELVGSASDTGGTLSEPVVGGPLNRGALVSKWTLDRQGNVVSGKRAYDSVFIEDTLVGPAAEVGNSTPPFARFCSGSLAGPDHGFDRYIYFANEESSGAATFDGLGGLPVAIFDNEAHALPALGRFAWENTLVQPSQPTEPQVVIMGMEDGPASQNPADSNSQLYLYVGTKDFGPDATVLERNGLVGGTLYVFRETTGGQNSEAAFQSGTITGQWVAIPNAAALSDTGLEAASDAAGAMVFARPEDGAFNPRDRHEYFFVTTGGAAGANVLGRLYSLRLDPADPTADATLTVVYNADRVIAAGGDIAISPDNIDASKEHLMINEDGTAESRLVMAAKGRDGSIWRFAITTAATSGPGVDVSTATRVAELDPPGRDGVAVGPGVWETSGIVDAKDIFQNGRWLFDVQAHPPTGAPRPNTVEDGQLLLLED
jgi:hypothetical protein